MSKEEQVSRQIEEYRKLAEENENVDFAALAMNAMGEAQEQADEIDPRKKRRAYLISVMIPPLGVLFFVKYFFSGKAGGKRVGMTCLVLTAAAILVSMLIAGSMFSGGTVTSQQIQDVNIEDVTSLFR